MDSFWIKQRTAFAQEAREVFLTTRAARLFRHIVNFPNFKFTSIEDGVKETINYFMENENV